jgi:hypothetical protein
MTTVYIPSIPQHVREHGLSMFLCRLFEARFLLDFPHMTIFTLRLEFYQRKIDSFFQGHRASLRPGSGKFRLLERFL